MSGTKHPFCKNLTLTFLCWVSLSVGNITEAERSQVPCDLISQKISEQWEDGSVDEFERLRELACSEKYSHCGFPCDDDPSEEDPAPPEQVWVQDPLGWLRRPMQCEQVWDQFNAIYQPLGAFKDLPDEKKEEINRAVTIICSERYAHCEFDKCAPFQKVKPREPARVVTNRSEAEKKLNSAYRRLREAHAEMIRIRVQDEVTRRISWSRFSVPAEVTESKKPDSRSLRPRKRKFQTPAGIRRQRNRQGFN